VFVNFRGREPIGLGASIVGGIFLFGITVAGGLLIGALALTTEIGDSTIEKIITIEIMNAMDLLCLYIYPHP